MGNEEQLKLLKTIADLRKRLYKAEKERDAAVDDLTYLFNCEYAKDTGFTDAHRWRATEYYSGLKCVLCKKFKHFDYPLPEDHAETCWHGNCKFEWRGLQTNPKED